MTPSRIEFPRTVDWTLPASVERPTFVSTGHDEWMALRASDDCRAATTGTGIERNASGRLECHHVDCPFHGDFCSIDRETDGGTVAIVHCAGEERAELVADLVATRVLAEGDRVLLLGEIERIYEEINWIHGLAERVRGERDASASIRDVLAHARSVLPIRAAAVWTPEGDSLRRVSHWSLDQIDRATGNLALPPHVELIFENGSPRILRETLPELPDDEREVLASIARDVGGLPAACLRLGTAGSFLGILVFGLDEDNSTLSTPEIRRLALTARQLSLCLQISTLLEELRGNEGLKKEIEIARQIQHGLLPQSIPTSPRYDLYAGCVTAARVGGDYYDFFPSGEKLGLLIADVSGHSVASGLIGVGFRSSFRYFSSAGTPIDEILSRVNASLFDELHAAGHFLSAFYASFDLRSGALEYVNAGHNHPFVYRKSTEEFFDLTESNLLIGILPETIHPLGRIALLPGDILVLYTDGIVEAENPGLEAFGTQRLKAATRKNASKSAKQLYHMLLREMYVFQDELFNKDDVTLVVLEVKDPGPRGGPDS